MQKDFNKNIKNSDLDLDLDCKACKDMLYDYVSDNLSAEDKTAVEKHIGLCPRCAEELTQVKGLISMLNGFEEVPAPKDLELSLNKALEETAKEIKSKNKRLRFRRVTSAVVPFAAAAVLAIGLYSGGAFDKYINSDSIFDGQSTYTEQSDNVSDDLTKNGDYNDDNANGLRDSEKAEESEKSENFADKNNTKTDNKNKSNKIKDNKNNEAVSEKNDNKKSDNIKSDNKKTENSSSKSQVSDKSNNSNKSENNGRDTDKSANTENTDNVNNTESIINTENTENTEQSHGAVPQNNEESNAKAVDGVSSGGGSSRARGGDTADAEPQPAVATYGLDDVSDESTDTAAEKSEESEKSNNSDKSDNSKNIGQRVPASCEIVTSNPEAYASLGLSTRGGSISYTLWESLRSIAVNNGDVLSAYDFADASVNSTVSVSLIIK